MSAVPVARQDFDLTGGVLRLTSLYKNRLILAELADGSAGKDDVLAAIGQAGIHHGLIDGGIDLLSKGYSGQVPLARAEVIDLPAHTSNVGLDLPIVEEVAVSGRFELLEKVDVSFPVKAGETLLNVGVPPKTIIRYPDGQERVLREHKSIDPELFSGKNTSVSEDGNAVVTDIDGLAHRTVYGSVSVYPSERISGIGSAHGKLMKESAFVVEQDISEGSHVETLSNLVVRGAVHGAYIRASGNIQIAFIADNPTRGREAKIMAGQSLRSRALQNTPVWAGSHVITIQGMMHCDIQCMNTVITPTISASKITVGNRLIVRDVKGDSTIKMGARFVSDPEMRDRGAVRSEHNKRFSDIERSLLQHRSVYNKTCESLVRQIERLRGSAVGATQKQKATQTIIRFINAMEESLEAYKKDFGEYVTTAEEITRGQVGLDYYRQRLDSFDDPHILVFGTMDSGTQIEGPVDKLTLSKPFSKGRIGIDSLTGKLKLEPHES